MKLLLLACERAGRGLAILVCGGMLALAMAGPAWAQAGCSAGACVSAGPRLVSVDSTRGPLLNALFQSLLPGTSVQLSVLDWNAIAQADIDLNALIAQLGADLGISDPAQVLNANITLAQWRAAMVQVLAADGQTAAANALGLLPLNVAGLAGTIRLADLLQISLPQGALANIDLDVLDLITGSVQLYNYRNVLTTPQPVAIDTAALGLDGIASTQLWLQIVEPPVYVCGPVGAQFYSAAVRAKINLEILGGFNLQPLLNAINALGLAGVSNVTLSQGALVVDLYADIARAQGTISQIDGLAQAVTVDAEPGIVDLYIGEIDDAVFFNRTRTIEPSDFAPQDISTLNLGFNVSLFGVGLVSVRVPLTVTAFAAAEGNPGPETLVFNGPYPQTQTVDSGAVSVGFLVTSLIGNLDLEVVAGPVSATVAGIPVSGAVLTNIINNFVNPIVNTLETTLQATSNAVLAPALTTVLGGVLDPVLGLLGIGLGEAVVTVEGIARSCAAILALAKLLQPADAPGLFNLSISEGATVLASATDVGNGGVTSPEVVTTPGTAYALAETAGSDTSLASYVATWACTDQDGNAVSSGAGSAFTLTAPALSSAPVTITCRITNRTRQADVSISKSDGLPTYTPGGNAIYVITVSNAGPDAMTGAAVSDTLPGGVTLSGPWTCTATQGACHPASGGAPGGQAIHLNVDLEAAGQATIHVPVMFSANPAAY